MDADKNGFLEFKEFVAMMGNRITNETMERELKEAFRYIIIGQNIQMEYKSHSRK